MKVLVACEFSGTVRDAFRALGHEAYSVDIKPAPGHHIQADALSVLNEGWDLMIAHPPCTYLALSGLHYNARDPERAKLTEKAVAFAKALAAAPIPRIAIENPPGKLNTAYRKPDQVIQPWQFGHDAAKATGLWLHNLPRLRYTKLVPPSRHYYGKPRWANQTNSGQNKIGPQVSRQDRRSITYPGIATAMAEQWGALQ